jgi:hypothetical protein
VKSVVELFRDARLAVDVMIEVGRKIPRSMRGHPIKVLERFPQRWDQFVDVPQVLAEFTDSMVLVGGWVPDLPLPDAEEAWARCSPFSVVRHPSSVSARSSRPVRRTRRPASLPQHLPVRPERDQGDAQPAAVNSLPEKQGSECS